MKKDLHNNPVVFWLLAAVAVGSFLFAIYTFEITKPSRNLVYRIYSKSFSIPEGLNQISIDSLDGSFRPTSGFIKEIYIWNSGNLEVEPIYLLQPIQLKFGSNEKLIEVFGANISNSSFKSVFFDKKLEINFDKLLPKAGFIIRYFSYESSNHPQIEGLIADPIRGASPIKDASLLSFFPPEERRSTWYWELLSAFLAPITLLGAVLSLKDIKPSGKTGRLL